jgi:hypothetical protein
MFPFQVSFERGNVLLVDAQKHCKKRMTTQNIDSELPRPGPIGCKWSPLEGE